MVVYAYLLMQIRFPKEKIDLFCSHLGPKFRSDVVGVGRIDGGEFVIESEDWQNLQAEHMRKTRLAEPSLRELSANFADAIARWSASGFKTATQDEYDSRAQICDGCDRWDAKARLGLGKCSAPGCGCTAMKRWLATEKCPLGKWSASA